MTRVPLVLTPEPVFNLSAESRKPTTSFTRLQRNNTRFHLSRLTNPPATLLTINPWSPSLSTRAPAQPLYTSADQSFSRAPTALYVRALSTLPLLHTLLSYNAQRPLIATAGFYHAPAFHRMHATRSSPWEGRSCLRRFANNSAAGKHRPLGFLSRRFEASSHCYYFAMRHSPTSSQHRSKANISTLHSLNLIVRWENGKIRTPV